MKKITVSLIAEKAQVSPATVSRVLNNPNYKCAVPELWEKIWKSAMELNYTPNKAARSLRTGEEDSEHKIYYISVLMTEWIMPRRIRFSVNCSV